MATGGGPEEKSAGPSEGVAQGGVAPETGAKEKRHGQDPWRSLLNQARSLREPCLTR
ncbi:hypothetical protein GCM10011534_18360 [Pseudooceanicola nanhaiensis]|uniref:Uncharacterized protein n=1 Tax=Pseudooceanicola nanhaiensis TaxID=375761 RepID=A0A917WEA1_9RHOB|nr:hypothetical protein GCM10011534_18360 [Pseudooceanicola nanhaiensis]